MPRVTKTHEANDAGGDAGSVQAVVFALQILEYLTRQRAAIRITDLACAFGTNKSRIFRHLRTLVQQGYIVQDADSEKYRIGTRLIALGRAVSENVDLVKASGDAMRNLRERLEHSVVLAQAQSDGVHVLSVLAGNSPIEIVVKPGSVLGFHYSAQGKVALAFGEGDLVSRVLQSRLERRTPATIVTAAGLREELDRVRRRGWAVAPGEAVIGLNALAAPVFDATGVLSGTVAIVDSVQFIRDEPSKEQVRHVVAAADLISRNLGHTGSPGARAG